MDINNDGHPDLLSGSWPGEIFLFKGKEGGSYDAPRMIKDKNDKYINIGGGIQKGQIYDGTTLIAGYAKFEHTPEGTFVNYHGQRIESTPERPIGITGTASVVHATDWDGDGDYDLIVGNIRGGVYLITNEGTAESYTFAKEQQLRAGDKLISVKRSAAPFTADWDVDGDLDLLVGADDGSVLLFPNTGDSKIPELASGVQLVPPGEKASRTKAPKDVRRGTRSKICVTDWNGDGRLDLLVGDLANQKPDRPEPTLEEKSEHERAGGELATLRNRYRELSRKLFGPSRVKEKEQIDQIQKEMKELRGRMMELRYKIPQEYERHGWVWLFLRKEI